MTPIDPGEHSTVKIAILDDYQDMAREFADWSQLPPDTALTVFTDHEADPERLLARLQPFDILCVMRERTPLPGALLKNLPNLKLIVTTGMKNAAIDVAVARERGIVVCGTRSPGHATAELTLALMLACARQLLPQCRSMVGGGWQVGLGQDLRDATLGVIGLGRLGAQVAGFGKALGMQVLAWSENLSEARAAEVGVARVSRDELLAQSDYITLHLRLSGRTNHLIDANALALMKSGAYLINTSRGPIVDTAALVEALRARRIGGAALDVYDEEPLAAEHALRELDNVILTPHVGYVTRQTYEVFYRETLEAVEAFLAGTPVREIG